MGGQDEEGRESGTAGGWQGWGAGREGGSAGQNNARRAGVCGRSSGAEVGGDDEGEDGLGAERAGRAGQGLGTGQERRGGDVRARGKGGGGDRAKGGRARREGWNRASEESKRLNGRAFRTECTGQGDKRRGGETALGGQTCGAARAGQGWERGRTRTTVGGGAGRDGRGVENRREKGSDGGQGEEGIAETWQRRHGGDV